MSGFYYIKIANGLLEPKHVEAMGEAVWLYMWLQDKNTSVNENGEGKVLGGRPVVFEDDIMPDLGIPRRTYSRWVDRLRDAGYIMTLRTPRGLVIVISKAKKYSGKGSAKSAHHQRSDSDVPEMNIPSDVPIIASDVPEMTHDVPKTDIQYKTTQHYTKTNTTKVVEPEASDVPVVYGKPEINELFAYWAEQCQFNIESRVANNRRAASNLLKKYGMEKVHRLIEGVAMTHSDRYAPGISDFCQLQQKLPDLLVWGRKKHGASAVEEIS